MKVCERSVLSVQDGRVTREQSPSMDIDVQEEEAEGKGLLFHCLLRRPYVLQFSQYPFCVGQHILPFSNKQSMFE